jgi:hypothetical protein
MQYCTSIFMCEAARESSWRAESIKCNFYSLLNFLINAPTIIVKRVQHTTLMCLLAQIKFNIDFIFLLKGKWKILMRFTWSG